MTKPQKPNVPTDRWLCRRCQRPQPAQINYKGKPRTTTMSSGMPAVLLSCGHFAHIDKDKM